MVSSLKEATTATPHRRILAIAGPAILANSSAPLVGLVDTWAIGHLPDAVHLAAVGLGSVIFNYLFWAFGFLRMATTGLVAQAWGQGDSRALTARILRSGALSLILGVALLLLQRPILALSLGALAPPGEVAAITAEYYAIRIWAAPASLLVFAASGVLFGLGRTRSVLVLQLVLNVTNGVLNVTFVIGLGMGVPGVALGTLIAQWLAAAAGLWLVVRIAGARPLLAAAGAGGTWLLSRFRRLVVINGFIFVRTVFLMTALAIIMRVAGTLGEVDMAASHVINQYMLLMALGLDGFAHAVEALAGRAWGRGSRAGFRRWVVLTAGWAGLASLAYAVLFWVAGDWITGLLTDIEPVRAGVADIMPLITALPIIAVWCYHLDGVYIGATAAAAMMVTMGIAFAVYLLVLGPATTAWGLRGLWGAVLVFMAARGLAQAAWYPRLEARLPAVDVPRG
jgi:MATE family multidrug resistance protein